MLEQFLESGPEIGANPALVTPQHTRRQGVRTSNGSCLVRRSSESSRWWRIHHILSRGTPGRSRVRSGRVEVACRDVALDRGVPGAGAWGCPQNRPHRHQPGNPVRRGDCRPVGQASRLPSRGASVSLAVLWGKRLACRPVGQASRLPYDRLQPVMPSLKAPNPARGYPVPSRRTFAAGLQPSAHSTPTALRHPGSACLRTPARR